MTLGRKVVFLFASVFLLIPICASGAVPGDVTGDAEVDVSDIQCTVLTNLNPTPPGCLAGEDSADLNCDGTVDIVDVQLIVLIVLAHPQNGVPEAQDANGNNVVDACESESCPNGSCDGGEDSCTCPDDCPGTCCGDGECEAPGETYLNCPDDCDAPSDDYLPGDVAITEIMKDPKYACDENGEWFEVRVLAASVDFDGWTIKDNGGDVHVINGDDLVFDQGAMVVFGNNANSALSGGVPVVYEYANFDLDNTNDGIILAAPDGTSIDQVFYNVNSFPNIPGRALSLNTTAMDADSNDLGANWCPATMLWGASAGDLGTPGFVNPNCQQAPTCGDDVVESWEQCDDGNVQGGDGCSAQCQFEELCGNGVLDAGEDCDDGCLLNGDGCDAFCNTEITCGNGVCDVDLGETQANCPDDCVIGTCGNGVTEGEEACDDGPLGSECCTTECTVVPDCEIVCGNNIIEPEWGEECDPPGTEDCDTVCDPPGSDNCDTDCWACDEWCKKELTIIDDCGDGIVTSGEDCEPPSQGDCNERCKWNWVPCSPSPCCGDGNQDPGEACDDGNDADGDGCSSTCTLEGGMGVSGAVECDSSATGQDALVVFASSSPIPDLFDMEEGAIEFMTSISGPDFAQDYELEIGEAGNYYVYAMFDKGGDGDENGYTEGVDVGGAYALNPAQVLDGQMKESVNISLDCGGAAGTGCVSGTISFTGNLTGDDGFQVGLTESPPMIDPVPVVDVTVTNPTFPYDFLLCNAPAGSYYVVASLDIGNNSGQQPGPEDFFGVYISFGNLQQVTVVADQTVSGKNFSLAPAP